MKYCKDCAHFMACVDNGRFGQNLCARGGITNDPVWGFRRPIVMSSAYAEREFGSGCCGPEARFWEPMMSD